ncbi:hypothetical protein CBS101457_004425 [Exobasidium rhododendri]|nr:hypothetical protein CBS101457_004425 [Exobasidium rhododendri]
MRSLPMLLIGLLLCLCWAGLPAQAASSNPHLCRCTCFVTNTTIVPLFSPVDPQNPCTTCTRQFCLNQGLEACKGARIERPDADTGTGWEGEVWAKCLRPDSNRDKTLISLYVLIILGLLAIATFRDRVEGIMGNIHLHSLSGVYRSVMASSWLQGAVWNRRQ